MSQAGNRNALPRGHLLYWYRIESILGQGGFGITYRAHDTNLQRDVAIKEYLPAGVAVREASGSLHPSSDDQADHYQWGFDRFLGEARVLARFNHPHIVRVLNVFEANNTAYTVMDYEEGASLFMQLRRQGITYDEPSATRLTLSLLSGLENVHEAGFIHRDIKPGNILIRKDGSPVLLDFGSARFAMGGRTQMLTAIVSPGYAPYEQYEGSGERQGPWTDIYGLGATLYVMASGGRPPVDAIARGNARIQGNPDPFLPATAVGRGRYSQRFLEALDAALGFTREERPSTVTEWRAMFPELGDAPGKRVEWGSSALVAGRLRSARGFMSGLRAVFSRWREPVRAVTERDSRASRGTGTVRIPMGARLVGITFRDPMLKGEPGPEMVVVPAGSFRMGDTRGSGRASERPVREVAIAKPFAVGVAPVTFDDYRRFALSTQRPLPDDHGWGEGNRPVINVSWRDATDYASWLAVQTGLSYRLLSESEWEYAARAGTDSLYWWGDEVGAGRTVCAGCGSEWDNMQTSPIGSFPANPYGLVDTLGNVWEWVGDSWHQDYAGAPTDGSAWVAGNRSLRVARGGAWNYEVRHVRCASRVGYTMDHRSSNLGFRVALPL